MEEKTQIKKFEESTMEMVLNKVNSFAETGNLHLPADYSLPNALRGAWLILQDMKDSESKPVLQSCTKDSIAKCITISLCNW